MSNENRMRKLDLKSRSISKGGHIFNVPLDEILEMPDWNVRDYDVPATEEHIRQLAEAFKNAENLHIDPLTIFVESGKIYIADGHCRKRAALLANQEGAEILKLPCVESLGNKDDLLALQITANKGLKPNAIERASIYQRYAAWGRDLNEISLKVNESASHIKQHLELLSLPKEIQDMIVSGKLAYTTALSEFEKFDSTEEALAAFEQGKEYAEKSGKKITPKAIQGDSKPKKKNKRYTKAIIKDMSSTLTQFADSVEVKAKDDEGKCTISAILDQDTLMRLPDLVEMLRAIESQEQHNKKEGPDEEQPTFDL